MIPCEDGWGKIKLIIMLQLENSFRGVYSDQKFVMKKYSAERQHLGAAMQI
jgi:hypothetical protein